MPLLFGGAAFLFLIAPGIDLAASSLFYEPIDGFTLGNTVWAQFFYKWSPRLVYLWEILLIVAVLASLWQRFRGLRRHALFLLAVLAVGPGLSLTVLKDHWGRARPHQIVEFGGDRQFTPAWVIAGQCEKNCSFASGHAAGAFSLMALAWVFPKRRRFWLVAGALWGAHMGLVRMAQGGHFLSDVVFSGFIVYFTAALLARWVFYRPAPS
ncbi:MAG: phosphatase PAP2 family protein [Candidatus Nitricoxidivorans perseverans]|uniref:Phosphatase PAP2 family protein n=1 Tax=Candidatus Nitricoxidivorans perseverans TaxID=2975601 RepID=A0AA49FL00_9PROT|nr:MAG: phosphatase PAP2 family protein [Candidatus Nitricoxidivorans perseverans]